MMVDCKQLKSIWVAGGEIRRRLVTIGTEPVVVMSKVHPILKPCFSKGRWKRFATRSELSPEVRREVDRWNQKLPCSFNCHAMSIGGLLGINASIWVEGSPSIYTLHTNPAQTLLDAYFYKVQSNLSLQHLLEAQEDDLVVLRDERSGDLVHSGRIRWLDTEPLLLSKFGEHPVAIAPIKSTIDEYQGQYDSIDIYRLAS